MFLIGGPLILSEVEKMLTNNIHLNLGAFTYKSVQNVGFAVTTEELVSACGQGTELWICYA